MNASSRTRLSKVRRSWGLPLALMIAACGGTVAGAGGGLGGGSSSSEGSGSGSGTATSSTTVTATASGTVTATRVGSDGVCVTLPPVTPADLTCNDDSDCTTTWTGTICSDACFCPSVAATTSTQAQDQSLLAPVFSAADQTGVGCGCPVAGQPHCQQHQCVLCSFEGCEPPDAGVIGTSDGGSAECVQINASDYSASCTTADDCTLIQTGSVCDGSCDCGGTPINASGLPAYNAAIQGITFEGCPCASEVPICRGGICILLPP